MINIINISRVLDIFGSFGSNIDLFVMKRSRQKIGQKFAQFWGAGKYYKTAENEIFG